MNPNGRGVVTAELQTWDPDPTHPDRDPTTQPVSRILPLKGDTRAWWEGEEGQEYIQHLQTAGLQDGASHCAKILSAMYASLHTDPSDPDVIIKLDISNAFNVLCR